MGEDKDVQRKYQKKTLKQNRKEKTLEWKTKRKQKTRTVVTMSQI